jgi:hypothetical protein
MRIGASCIEFLLVVFESIAAQLQPIGIALTVVTGPAREDGPGRDGNQQPDRVATARRLAAYVLDAVRARRDADVLAASS